ncbi:MAG: helix-turn-helix transcriptional regulator [Betaproteobacteria bacterium]|jgi:transcriptional regulator with XRE-family HTH domain
MPSKPPVIFPNEKKILTNFGERIRLARLRREISAETLAAQSLISRMTLHRAEKGSPAVSLGVYLRIMAALGLQSDFDLLAKDDVLGRKLQDLELAARRDDNESKSARSLE